ncbi:hypothetical protein CMO89_00525 [Candidatus Woesearchaeota archaeon]|nr:hypothetical protein [Candidatus Woesearchaeota archaeon]|tara:strand:- start:23031 stop:24407 length:1377 start_codon:yes stop_codon:yes gene_type:complete
MSDTLVAHILDNDQLAIKLGQEFWRSFDIPGTNRDSTVEDYLLAHPLLINEHFKYDEYRPIVDAVTRESLAHPEQGRCEGKVVYLVWGITSRISPQEGESMIRYAADALYRERAKEVNLITYLFKGRQDMDPALRFNKKRFSGKSPDEVKKLEEKLESIKGESFSLEVMLQGLFQSGIRNIITLNAHSYESTKRVLRRVFNWYKVFGEEHGLPNSPSIDKIFYDIDSMPIFAHYIKYNLSRVLDFGDEGENLVLLSLDKGDWGRTDMVYDLLGLKNMLVLYLDKDREIPDDPSNLSCLIDHIRTKDGRIDCKDIEDVRQVTNISGKILLLPDDIINTGGTIFEPLHLFSDGMPEYVFAFAPNSTLPPRTGVYKKIYDNRVNIVTSDSHPNLQTHRERGATQITVLSFAKYFADIIRSYVSKSRPLPSSLFTPGNLEEVGNLYEIVTKGREFVPYRIGE